MAFRQVFKREPHHILTAMSVRGVTLARSPSMS
jgi:hypothetical protein